jgi:hypothetical protein
MKRVFTATCLAATFAVGLAAQSAGTTGSTAQDPQTAGGGQGRGGPRTVTGCLRAGDTAGTYMLTDVEMQGGGAAGGATTTAGSAAGGGTTAGAAGTQGRGGAPGSIMLTADSSVDLKAHVGHKVEVTGTMAGGGRRGGGGATTGTATGTTAGGTTTGGTSTATGTGSTSGTGTAGATGTGQGQGGGRGPRSMTVTNVRMVSESCS